MSKINWFTLTYSCLGNLITTPLYALGCQVPSWKGDKFCDDVNNVASCEFDGGDCCGSNVNKQFCTVCKCKQVTTTTAAPTGGNFKPVKMIFSKHRNCINSYYDIDFVFNFSVLKC